MNQKNLKKFKKILLAEREKIHAQLNFEKESIDHLKKKEIGDMVDNAFNMYEKNRTIEMSENDKKILLAINEALLRINNNRYGHCQRCGKEISLERLTAVPWTVNCVDLKTCNINK